MLEHTIELHYDSRIVPSYCVIRNYHYDNPTFQLQLKAFEQRRLSYSYITLRPSAWYGAVAVHDVH